jgi:hypothetical protein
MGVEVQIPLSNGGVTRIDEADVPLLAGYLGFRKTSHGYVSMHKSNDELVYLHRHIMGATKGRTVDHINRDKLDNRRINLRFVSLAENVWNAASRRDNTSGARGVWRARNKWHARINIRGTQILLGNFDTVGEASIAYEAALKVRDTLWPISQSA